MLDGIGDAVTGLAGLLARAERVAAAADAEILVGDAEPVLGVAQQGEAAPGGFGGIVVVQEQAKACPRAAADPAAQLVELSEPEALRMFDDHHVGLRDVDADLDHRGGDENLLRPSAKSASAASRSAGPAGHGRGDTVVAERCAKDA